MGLSGIFVIALFATAATVGLRTGSLSPYWPTVSRADAPAKFWTVIGLCTVVVVANVVNLIVG
jgi:hypothetical protein